MESPRKQEDEIHSHIVRYYRDSEKDSKKDYVYMDGPEVIRPIHSEKRGGPRSRVVMAIPGEEFNGHMIESLELWEES